MSVVNTLAERGNRYGVFADHAKIAQGLQDVMRAAPRWQHLDFDMKQALSVIADKIARILNGDPFYTDNWHDLQGYAKLIEDRLNMIPSTDEGLFEEVPVAREYYDTQAITPVALGGNWNGTEAQEYANQTINKA